MWDADNAVGSFAKASAKSFGQKMSSGLPSNQATSTNPGNLSTTTPLPL
jgi:hypothetical protein